MEGSFVWRRLILQALIKGLNRFWSMLFFFSFSISVFNLQNPTDAKISRLSDNLTQRPLEMAMKIPLLQFSPNNFQQHRKFPNRLFTATTLITNRPKRTLNISCTKKNLSDTALALDWAISVEKINTLLEQKEEAMKKSKELLFSELCHYLSLKEGEVNKKWRKMKEEEKLVLVQEFVNEWSVNFHPLSVRSIKEMVDEYLQDDKSSSAMFPGLKRMLGFSEDT